MHVTSFNIMLSWTNISSLIYTHGSSPLIRHYNAIQTWYKWGKIILVLQIYFSPFISCFYYIIMSYKGGRTMSIYYTRLKSYQVHCDSLFACRLFQHNVLKNHNAPLRGWIHSSADEYMKVWCGQTIFPFRGKNHDMAISWFFPTRGKISFYWKK